MQLHGIHHVTAITGDAPGNVDFYARVLGMRMIKKTVNFDAPDVYHLYYGDEQGSPGSALTFFEFPGAARGRAGDGMVHRVVYRVGSPAALEFWAERLGDEGVSTERVDASALRFTDPEGLENELRVVETPDPPLIAAAPDVPAGHALLGFDGVRAYAAQPERSRRLLDALGFQAAGEGEWATGGEQRHASYVYDVAPGSAGIPGAGTVHHVAWMSLDDEHAGWRERAREGGARPTPVIDRDYFFSIYFREPSGVLFEIATPSPGFTRDEPLESLGESLRLPARYESMREDLERRLTPLHNPRAKVSS